MYRSFFATLITGETFAELCSGKIPTIEIDKTSAKSWFDSVSCPILPFDSCSQGGILTFPEVLYETSHFLDIVKW